MLTTSSAGWVFRVRRSSSSGPSKQILEIGEAEDLVGPVEKRPGLGRPVVEVLAHAHGLGSLSGEEIGDVHFRQSFLIWMSARFLRSRTQSPICLVRRSSRILDSIGSATRSSGSAARPRRVCSGT